MTPATVLAPDWIWFVSIDLPTRSVWSLRQPLNTTEIRVPLAAASLYRGCRRCAGPERECRAENDTCTGCRTKWEALQFWKREHFTWRVLAPRFGVPYARPRFVP